MKKIFTIIIIGLSISCQTDWIVKTDRIIKKSENKFKLVKKTDSIENGVSTKIYLYQSNNISRLEVNFKYENFIDMNDKYYKNDTIVFAKIATGLSPIIYKRKRKIDEPISELIEKISYFKNEKTGIEKVRHLKFYENDDIKTLKLELSKKDFEVKEIGEQEYLHIEKMYDRYNRY